MGRVVVEIGGTPKSPVVSLDSSFFSSFLGYSAYGCTSFYATSGSLSSFGVCLAPKSEPAVAAPPN